MKRASAIPTLVATSLLLLVVAATAPVAFGAPQSNVTASTTHESTAPLAETLDWIQNTIANYAKANYINSGSDTSEADTLSPGQGCSVTIQFTRRSPPIVAVVSNLVPLDQIDPRLIGVMPLVNSSPNAWMLVMANWAGKKLITRHVEVVAGVYGGEDFMTGATDGLVFSDQSMADRTANAFRHAVALCQAQNSPF
jgi:hypothetical protein